MSETQSEVTDLSETANSAEGSVPAASESASNPMPDVPKGAPEQSEPSGLTDDQAHEMTTGDPTMGSVTQPAESSSTASAGTADESSADDDDTATFDFDPEAEPASLADALKASLAVSHRFRLTHETSFDKGKTWTSSVQSDYEYGKDILHHVVDVLQRL